MLILLSNFPTENQIIKIYYCSFFTKRIFWIFLTFAIILSICTVYNVASVSQNIEFEEEKDEIGPQYKYAYTVEDSVSGDNKGHVEERDGDVVRGEYSLIDADGFKRTVSYTADAVHGFQAVVKREPLSLTKNAKLITKPITNVVSEPLSKVIAKTSEKVVLKPLSEVASPLSSVNPVNNFKQISVHPRFSKLINVNQEKRSETLENPTNYLNYAYFDRAYNFVNF